MSKLVITPLERLNRDRPSIIRQHPDVARWLISPPLPITHQDQNRWFDRYEKDESHFVFVTRDEGVYVGYCQVRADQIHRGAEVGLAVDPKHQRKGYGTEIVEYLLGFVHHNMSFHRAWLRVLADNEAAIALFEKAGFVREGVLREAVIRGPNMGDVVIMSHLWSDEWEKLG